MTKICDTLNIDCNRACKMASYYNDKIKHLEALVKKYKFDCLTGLMGKSDCFDKMDEMFGEYIDSYDSFYLCLIDLDDLHNINKLKGYYEGDEVIKDVAIGLKTHFAFHHIFRISGDEFAVLIRRDETSCEHIKNSLDSIDGITYYVSNVNGYVTAKHMFKCVDEKLTQKKITKKRI